MSIKPYPFKPDYRVHPCETLKETLDYHNISTEDFCKKLGIDFITINGVLEGKSPVTEYLAEKFEEVLDIPKSFWLNAQKNYDEFTK